MRVAVAGAGWWGGNIVNTLQTMGSVSAVHVFDTDPAAFDKFKANRKAVRADSWEAVLQNPEIRAVCIATPPQTHASLAEAALSAGKHVLVEKPPAFSVDQVERLGDLARRNGVVYMLDALYLYLPAVEALKRMAEKGDLGDIRFVQVYRIGDELRRQGAGLERIRKTMFDNGTGVVDDLFFHDAGILTYLFGELSLESVRRYRLYHPDLADSAVVRFYAGKIPVELTLSWSFTGRRRGITIYSSDRIVEYDALAQGPQITVHRLESNEKEQLDFPQVQPLTALLEAFVSAVAFGLQVPFGPDFMKILVRLWRKVSNAR